MTNLKNYPVITALITPFNDFGQVDYISLEKLVRVQEAANNAILLLGSTGEALALNEQIKKEIVEFVFSLKPHVPVVVGLDGFQLEVQCEFMRNCAQKYPLSGFLLLTPMYAKPGIKGQLNWFKALLDTTSVPCILYNIPGRTGVELYPKVIKSLVNHPQFLGLKEASGNLDTFSEYQHIMPEHILYSGNDELLADQVKRGAFGIISVAANAWPKATQRYLALCQSGQNTPVFDQAWLHAAAALFCVSNPVPVKVLLHREGMIASPKLLPPLTHHELSEEDTQKLVQYSKSIRDLLEESI